MKSEFISWVQISEYNCEQVVHILSLSQSCMQFDAGCWKVIAGLAEITATYQSSVL